jgi:uncharacterized membrane protein YphA (DoxX/SURF4 family)
VKYFILFLRFVSAGILLQTLFFKFSAAPESVYIFSTLGAEPWGRWISGVAEFIAGVFLLIPTTAALGALMAVGIMAGALLSHIFILGIDVQGDHGLLFGLAMAVFTSCTLIVIEKREQLLGMAQRLKKRS